MVNALRLLLFALVLLIAPGGWAQALTVHFLDVGQGDAALIRSPTGRTVLIDGGPPESASALLRRVEALAGGPLDLVILSHPHLDHLGGLPDVLDRVGTKRLLEPGFDHTTPQYAALLEQVQALGIELRVTDRSSAKPDEPLVIGLGGGATLEVLWPRRPKAPFIRDSRSDVNANSIVARLSHLGHRVLFTGDAEPEAEALLLELGTDLRADVLKVGHHGSRYSSTSAFLAKVRPSLAVISCGVDNAHGHPAQETLQRLAVAGARVLRTDLDGEVTVTLDARGVHVQTARRPGTAARVERSVVPVASHASGSGVQAATHVASRRGKVFHRADCPAVSRIKEGNRVQFTSREAAAQDKTPAKDCKP